MTRHTLLLLLAVGPPWAWCALVVLVLGTAWVQGKVVWADAWIWPLTALLAFISGLCAWELAIGG